MPNILQVVEEVASQVSKISKKIKNSQLLWNKHRMFRPSLLKITKKTFQKGFVLFKL